MQERDPNQRGPLGGREQAEGDGKGKVVKNVGSGVKRQGEGATHHAWTKPG